MLSFVMKVLFSQYKSLVNYIAYAKRGHICYSFSYLNCYLIQLYCICNNRLYHSSCDFNLNEQAQFSYF